MIQECAVVWVNFEQGNSCILLFVQGAWGLLGGREAVAWIHSVTETNINSNIKQKHCTTHQGIESKRLIKRHIKQLFNNFFQSLFGDWQFSTFQEMIVFAILRYNFLCNKKKQKSELESHTVHGDHLILRNVKVWHKSLTFVFQKLSYFPSQNKLVKKYSREIIVGSMCGAPTSKEQVKSHQNWEHSKKINQNCWFFCLDRLGKWHLFAAISCLACKE